MRINCDERGLSIVEICRNAAYYIFKSDKIGIHSLVRIIQAKARS